VADHHDRAVDVVDECGHGGDVGVQTWESRERVDASGASRI
jgi:hypothetical protein